MDKNRREEIYAAIVALAAELPERELSQLYILVRRLKMNTNV